MNVFKLVLCQFVLVFTMWLPATGAAWQEMGAPAGGEIVSLVVARSNPQYMYASTYNGRVYRSSSGGAAWSVAADTGVNGYVSALAVDTVNPQVIYAGTSDGFFKSTNAGDSWSSLDNGFIDGYVSTIAIDPTSPQTIYVGTRSGLFKTFDGGGTWHHVVVSELDITSIAIDPVNPLIVYFGADDYSGAGVYKSVDGGLSWVASNGGVTGFYVNVLAVNPLNSQVIYAGTADGVYKSSNGGNTWIAINTELTEVNALAIDPNNPQIIYIGTHHGMFSSMDGGGSWRTITVPGFPLVYTVSINPGNSQIIHAGTLDGVFVSLDSGGSWKELNTGLNDISLVSLAIDPVDDATIYVGTSYHGVYKSTDRGVSWSPAKTGMRLTDIIWAMAINTDNPLAIYAGGEVGVHKTSNGGGLWSHVLAQGTVRSLLVTRTAPESIYVGIFGGIYRSTDGGATWNFASNGIPNVGTPTHPVYPAVYALAGDPNNVRTLYAGTGSSGIFKSTDGGDSWSAVNTGLSGNALNVFSLVVDPIDPMIVYAGTTAGVLKSTKGGGSWSAVLGEANIRSLAINPHQSLTLYAGSRDGIWKSTNGGISWSAESEAPPGYFNSLGIAAVNPTTVYALTAEAVFRTTVGLYLPIIGGTPAATATIGTAYSFTPSSSYATSFSIGNKPRWANFDTSTGRLSGIPGTADVGTFGNIIISAINSSGQAQLIPFSITVSSRTTIWPATVVPGGTTSNDGEPLELGVKFRSDVKGSITGVRFYKAASNTGTHIAHLWSSSGTLLASAPFTNETPFGWQEVAFTTPVAIPANTTYIASYHSSAGYYSADVPYFTTAVDNPPLHALADGTDGGNGVYKYGSSGFPRYTYNGSNYWVDVVFDTVVSADTTPPVVTAFVIPATSTVLAVPITTFTATDASGVTGYLVTESATTPSPAAAGWTATAPNSYMFATSGSKTLYAWAKDAAGNVSGHRSAVVTIKSRSTIWPSTAMPSGPATSDGEPLEVGVKFRSDINGNITGLRFYKAAFNTGTHTAHLWSRSGTLLASAPFTNETASGWQEVAFSTPVAITANTTYIASYHSSTGYYSADDPYFTRAVDNPPLHALADGTDGGNGVYKYGSSGFPMYTYNASNYWVDVVFDTAVAADTTPPVVTAFVIPATSSVLTVPIITFTATDARGVTGYLVTESAVPPSPAAAGWTATAPGSYTFATPGVKTLYAWARDAAGNVSAGRSATITITNTAPGLKIDARVSADISRGGASITTPVFSTGSSRELLLAFVAGANPTDTSPAAYVTGVSGGGLTWTLVRRTNAQHGTAEIWRAFADSVINSKTITATFNQSVSSASVTVVSFTGADISGTNGSGAIGATGSANSPKGAPQASLTTTRANSWVFGVGNDWDSATARTMGPNQTMEHQYLSITQDSYWVQRQNSATPLAGTIVTINDTAPVTDRYNLTIVEILPSLN